VRDANFSSMSRNPWGSIIAMKNTIPNTRNDNNVLHMLKYKMNIKSYIYVVHVINTKLTFLITVRTLRPMSLIIKNKIHALFCNYVYKSFMVMSKVYIVFNFPVIISQ
jgi:hypothetical protein